MKTFSTLGTTSRTAGLNTLLAATLAIASTLLPGLAQADTSSGRAEVKAALAEAQRTGNLPDYETGKMLFELFPGTYPKAERTAVAPAPAAVPAPALDIRPAAGPTSKTNKTGASNTAIGVFDYDLITQRTAETLARQVNAGER